MVISKRSFQTFLILSAVWISFTCAPPNPSNFQRCKDMLIFKNANATPLKCVRIAIEILILEPYLNTQNDDLGKFTKHFYDNADARKILVPSEFCSTKTRNLRQRRVEEKRIYSEDKEEYQRSIIHSALYYHRKIDVYQAYAFRDEPNCHLTGTYGHEYLSHLAHKTKLKSLYLRTLENVQPLKSPIQFCREKYDPNTIEPQIQPNPNQEI